MASSRQALPESRGLGAERQTDRQTDRETKREVGREEGREGGREGEREREREGGRKEGCSVLGQTFPLALPPSRNPSLPDWQEQKELASSQTGWLPT